jgi:hypothetical protein
MTSAVTGFSPQRKPCSKARVRCCPICSGGAQPFGEQRDCRVIDDGGDPAVLGLARTDEPRNVRLPVLNDVVESEVDGAIANLFHGRAAQIVAQFGVSGEDDGQRSAAVGDDFHEPLEPHERLGM